MLTYMALIDDPSQRSLFEQLYLAHRDRMFYIANGILRDTHWAEDVVSEAFLKIAKNMKKISTMNSQEQVSFFVIIVRSCAIDIYLKRQKETGIWEDTQEHSDGQYTVEDTIFSTEGYQRLLRAIDSQADKLGIVQDILLEVNVAREESKGGVTPEALPALAELALSCPHVRLRGLMAIPPVSTVSGGNRKYFAQMRHFLVDIIGKMSDNYSVVDCLSMGMSGDYEDAIAEGATLVRVGTALFGPRPYPAGPAR